MRRLLPCLAVLVLLAGCGGEGSSSDDPKLEISTVATGLDTPWAIGWLPDGRALFTERRGDVRLLEKDGTLRSEPVGVISDVVETDGSESGLLGLAIDPAFEQNHFVYLYLTTPAENLVGRWRFERDQLTFDAVVVQGIESGPIHDGGRIAFGPDGRLYITTGETGDASLAQADGLNGKVLRTKDFHGRQVTPEVFTKGHRNVQGIDWQPGTGRAFITELGPDENDEVNVLEEGGNYGWPDGGGVKPLVTYEDVISPSGATFVAGDSSWKGDFVFAALSGEQLRRLSFDGDEVSGNQALLEGRYGRLRDVEQGPDGALYVLTSNKDGRGDPTDDDDRILKLTPP
jgi:aldose sugar dehydrogenase